MRGTVSKRIRAAARKKAANDETKYKIKLYSRILKKIGLDGKPEAQTVKVGTVFCIGYRRVYQDMKHQYLRGMA